MIYETIGVLCGTSRLFSHSSQFTSPFFLFVERFTSFFVGDCSKLFLACTHSLIKQTKFSLTLILPQAVLIIHPSNSWSHSADNKLFLRLFSDWFPWEPWKTAQILFAGGIIDWCCCARDRRPISSSSPCLNSTAFQPSFQMWLQMK